MASEYNLGRAKGEIDIEFDDNGTRKAKKAMRDVDQEANRLSKSMDKLERSTSRNERTTRTAAAAAVGAAKDTRGFDTSVKGLGQRLSNASTGLYDFQKKLKDVGNQALVAAHAIETLSQGIRGIPALDLEDTIIGGNRIKRALGNMSAMERQVYDLGKHITALTATVKVGDIFLRRFFALDAVGRGIARMTAFGAASAVAGRQYAQFGAFLVGSSAGLNRGISRFRNLTAGLLATGTGANLLTRAMQKGLGTNNAFTRSITGMTRNISKYSHTMRDGEGSLRKFINSGKSMSLLGKSTLGLVTSASRLSFGFRVAQASLSQLVKTSFIASGALIAIGAAASALKGIGTLILGVADAVKQLSGLFLLLPGAIASAATVMGVLKVATMGVKDAFKAAFEEDPTKFLKSLEGLSPPMRELALSVREVAPALRDIRNATEVAFWNGIGTEIDKLGKNFLPSVRFGFVSIAQALRGSRGELVKFLTEKENVDDFNKNFSNTRKIIENLNKAIVPVLEAFRDIGTVGQEVLVELSGHAEGLATRFRDFIAEARQTGELKRWLTDAISGAKDLGTIVVETGRIFATVFKAFGSDGSNALERFSGWITRARQNLQTSMSGGGFGEFIRAVNHISSKAMETLLVVFDRFGDTAANVARLVVDFFDGFAASVKGLMTNFLAGYGVIEGFVTIIDTFNIAPLLGGLAALVAYNKILKLLATPIKALAAAFVGLGASVSGGIGVLKKGTTAIGAANSQFGILGKTVKATTKGIGAVGGAISRAMGGPIVLGIIALTTAVMAVNNSLEKTSEVTQTMRDSAKQGAEGVNIFAEAFKKANGVMSQDVLEKATEQFQLFADKQKELAGSVPGAWDYVADELNNIFGHMFSLNPFEDAEADSKEFQDRISNTEAAEKFSQAIDKMHLSSDAAGQAITGTDKDYQAFLSTLKAGGADTEQAVQYLQQQRDAFVKVKDSMDRLGPSTVAVSNGLDTIRDASSSAEDKLSALKNVLEELGFIQSSAEEASADYAQQLYDTAQAAQDLLDATQPKGDSLLNGGHLDVAQENARRLRTELLGIAEALQKDAIKNPQNIDKIFADSAGPVNELAGAAGLDPKELNRIFQEDYAGKPQELKLILSVVGQDAVTADITEAVAEAQKTADGAPIKIMLDPTTAESTKAMLEGMGAQIKQFTPETGELQFTGLSDEKLASILATLQNAANAQNPLNIPAQITPGTVPGQAASPSDILQTILGPVQKNADNNPLQIPSVVTPPANTPAQGGLSGLMLPPGSAPAPAAVAPAVKAPDVSAVPQAATAAQAAVTTSSMQMQTDIGTTNELWNAFAGNVTTNMQTANTAVTTSTADIGTKLTTVADSAQASGLALANGFADGIRQGTFGPTGVAQAALDMAGAASAPLPRSPAKIGPFSGSGWTLNRGRKLSQAFAQGISDGAGDVSGAAGSMAGGASDAMDKNNAFGAIKGLVADLSRLSQFGQHLVDLASSFGEIATTVATMITTDWKTGKSTLAKTFSKTVSDEDLRQKRADSFQSSIGDRTGGTSADFGSSLKKGEIPLVQNADGTWGSSDPEWDKLIKRESGGNAKIVQGIKDANSGGNEASGLFQIAMGTWASNGGTAFAPSAKDATPEQQAQIAAKIFNEQGVGPWGGRENEDKLRAGLNGGGYTRNSIGSPIGGPSKLRDTGQATTKQNLQALAAELTARFPGIASIGGSRDSGSTPDTHGTGKSIDVMIGEVTKANQAMGDQINEFVRQNAAAFGVEYTIWRDQWKDFKGNQSTVGGHQNHIDIHTADPGESITGDKPVPVVSSTPSGKPVAVPEVGQTLGTDVSKQLAEAAAAAQGAADDKTQSTDSKQYQDDVANQQILDSIIAAGKQRNLSMDEISGGLAAALSQQTDGGGYKAPLASANAFFDALKGTDAAQSIFERSNGAFGSAGIPSGFEQALLDANTIIGDRLTTSNDHLGNIGDNTLSGAKSTDQLVQDYLGANPDLASAIETAKDPNADEAQVGDTLAKIASASQNTPEDTAQNRALKGGLDGIQNEIADNKGFTEDVSPIDQAKEFAGDASGIAQDFFGVFDATLKAITAATDIGATLVRGIENTGDINNIVDDFQSFLELGAKIASTVGDVASMAGKFTGGSDFGATAAVGQIASLVGGIISAVNSTIDLVQEGISIAGTYVGRFLGNLAGGAAGALDGDVKFLLDTQTGVLQTYSSNNPADKREHQGYGATGPERTTVVNNNMPIYGGPGQDPRDTMSEAMWQVRTSGIGAFGSE